MERTAAKDAQNREIARSNGSADTTRNLSAIADNLAEKSKNLLKNVDKAFAETNPLAQCADLLDGMHAKCRTITARMTEISKQLRKGTLTDREKILAQLFDMKEFSELSGMLRNIHIKIKDAAPGNTALLDFSNNLAVYIKSVNGEYDGLRNEYKRAVAADLLPVATQKLNDAVSCLCLTRGMYWGTPYESYPLRWTALYKAAKDNIEPGDEMSVCMATSFIAWLSDRYGFDRVSRFCFDRATFEEAFASDYSSAYEEWSAWILDRCGGI
jgi:hypothetical protein